MRDEKSILLSIILPMYNAEKYLAESIESVLRLEDRNYELIIIDDGSKDCSLEIANSYKDNDKVRIYQKENSGPSDSRDLGIQKARGRYITFLDSDDYYLDPEKLFDVIRKMKRTRCEMACFDFESKTDEKKKEADIRCSCVQAEDIAVRLLADRVTTRNGIEYAKGIGITLWNKIFDRKVFDSVSFPKGVFLMDDFEVCYEAMFVAKRVLLCDGVIYFYRKHFGSITLTNFSEKNYELVDVPTKVMKKVENIYGKKAKRLRPGYAVIYLSFINRLYSAGKRDEEYEERLQLYIRDNASVILQSKDISLFHKTALIGFGYFSVLYRWVMKTAFTYVMRLRFHRGLKVNGNEKN